MSDLDEMERRIREIFDRAGKELEKKWAEWLKGIDADLELLNKQYKAAKDAGDGAAMRKAGIALSKAKKAKIMGNEYYDKMVKQAAARLNDANKQAMAYINGKMPGVYASSFNGSTTQIAKDLPHNIGVSFDLVDESTVARLMRDPTLDLSDFQGGINGTKMAAWNSRAISSEILQGIVSGDSMPRIAGRIMNVAGMDMRAAMRNARTMTTGAENAGREDSYLRAQDMGIKLHQQWIAALDGRTRHSHRQLDGEVQEVGKPFSNGLRFPGDPNGRPEEIYNCRCTLVAKLDGFDREKVERWDKLDGMDYETWKTGGKAAVAMELARTVENADILLNRNGKSGIINLTEEQNRQRFTTTEQIAEHFRWEDKYGDTYEMIDIESFRQLEIETQNRIANGLDYMIEKFPNARRPLKVSIGGPFSEQEYGKYNFVERRIRLNPKLIVEKGQEFATVIHEMVHHYDHVLPGTAKETVNEALRSLKIRRNNHKTEDQFIIITKSTDEKVWMDDREIVARSIERNAIGKSTPLTLAIEKAFLRRIQ